jgi:hypothetical protein
MVFIYDSGSIFEASLDMVWRLAQDHVKQGNKIHPNTRNNRTEIISETSFINSWEQDETNGQTIRMGIKGTFYYPLGIAFEILEGPFVDSKYFVYYFPLNSDNSKTGVTVVGNFTSNTLPEDQIKSVVFNFLEKVFDEDVIYLNTLEQDKTSLT